MARRATFKGTYVEPTTTDQDGKVVPTGERMPTAFVDGIPARDLTDEDWDALSDEQRKAVEASPLYTVESRRSTSRKDGES